MPAIVATPPTNTALIRSYARLGLTSFGGPVAHIGYYRTAFIEQTRWMDDDAFAERPLCDERATTTSLPPSL